MANSLVPCRLCHNDLPARRTCRLWDGQDYCFSCLDAVAPELRAFLESNSMLSETMPDLRSEVFARVSRILGLVMLGFALLNGLVFACSVGTVQPVMSFLVPFLLTLGVGLPLAILFAVIDRHVVGRRRPTVAVRDGMVSVLAGPTSYELPLSDITWRAGNLFHTNILGQYLILPSRPAIVLTWRSKGRIGPAHLAVGYTAQSRNIWQAFLTVAGVNKRRGN